MADLAQLQHQIEVLKFQLSIVGFGTPDGEEIKAQIAELQQQLAFEKVRQGGNN